jgi:hypothetical protein
MSAYAKAKSLGLVEERKGDIGERTKAREKARRFIVFMGRHILVKQSPAGPLAVADGKPIQPKAVEAYLTSKFGENLDRVRAAMAGLARSRSREALAREAFHLYEKFRPSVPAGVAGWGKVGVLKLDQLKKLH